MKKHHQPLTDDELEDLEDLLLDRFGDDDETIEGRDEGIPTVTGPIEVSFDEDDANGTVDLLAGEGPGEVLDEADALLAAARAQVGVVEQGEDGGRDAGRARFEDRRCLVSAMSRRAERRFSSLGAGSSAYSLRAC